MKMDQNILLSIVKRLKVRHTASFTKSYFAQNHNNDNLLGLAQMLNAYNIENKSLVLTDKKYGENQSMCVAYKDKDMFEQIFRL